jgi:8-oxo-dGTP diphosphatase
MAPGPRSVEGYDPGAFPAVAVTVDMVVLTIRDGELQAVLVERGEEPFRGRWALPGGFIRPDETLDQAATRELREETGLRERSLEQLGAYGDPDRDPRMRIVTVAYLAIVPTLGSIIAGSDASAAQLVPVRQSLGRRPKYRLAFDHRAILDAGVERAREKLETTSIATAFVGREFTLSELRAVYEAAWGLPLDPGNFRRKVLATPGFVVPTGERGKPGPGGGKPPEIYRAGSTAKLDPPLRRPGLT